MGEDISLILYGVPTAPGWSRVYVTFAGDKSSPNRLPNAPGMPPAIRAIVNALSMVTPLFHALTQNNIIGGWRLGAGGWGALGGRLGVGVGIEW